MKNFLKKSLSSSLSMLIIGASLAPLMNSTKANNSYKRTFVTTAYYSPLPNQSFYVTGSYRGDIILNGNGTNGASGREVFEGMLAAPKTYKFGSQVSCGDVLSGTIEDRGGAIVPAGQQYSKFGIHAHDRLDIWSGQGEKGLISALKWGKRTLTCTVYPDGANLAQFVNLPQADFSVVAKKYVRPAKNNVAADPSNGGIPTLYKNRLTTLGFDSNDKDHLIAFQLAHKIIDSRESKFAGQFGPNTRNKLNEIFYSVANSTAREGLGEKDIDPDVRKLQQALKDLGYLTANPTAIFGPQTKAALVKFQLDNNLIETAEHPAAGYLGPGTHNKLKELALKNFFIKNEQKNEITEWKRIRKLDIVKKESVEAANELAKHSPKVVTETPDEIQAMIKDFGNEWIQEHTPFDTPEEPEFKLATAETKNDNKQIQLIKAKLEPLFTPFKKHLKLGSVSDDIKNIQHFLTKTGHYDGEIYSNYFGPKTESAVIAFQLEHNIIESKESAGAGIIGPKTVSTFNMVHIADSYTLQNHQISNSIRKPAIHPNDLKEAIPLQQAKAGKSA
ncbi:MAG: peptidoglycan-binding protein [Candidatus Gracilibacteria bacterium]|nr:peptidoglycan-binding protein [Candidatus Gracilibacteria bacterium]